ncbi:MAG: sugar phosphate isomerase/epimerase [Mesorhizobium sp.]|nr:sugar phosphate isomerase/epimerase [Mesorhizobium sp.]
MNWSFQLYSARNFQPWDSVLDLVAAAGYTQVEGFGGVYGDLAGLRAGMDRNGLAMPTAHFSIDLLENDFDEARRIASTLGVETMICPHIVLDKRPADAAGWSAFGERLAAVGKTAAAAGYGFGWHNHDFEFKALPDGSVPMQLILDAAPDIGIELDVAWVVRGGADPLDWIDRYAGRIIAVHVKDIAPAGEAKDEDGWADVGHGTIDWAGIMPVLRARTPARVFIMEHDNPSDLGRFARRSIAAANRY